MAHLIPFLKPAPSPRLFAQDTSLALGQPRHSPSTLMVGARGGLPWRCLPLPSLCCALYSLGPEFSMAELAQASIAVGL
jgi:hypothetical protein